MGSKDKEKEPCCDEHTDQKEQSGECSKQKEKPNALDEFWKHLGEPDKCKPLIQSQ